MAEQLSLMGLEDKQPRDRLFFALFPPEGVAARLARVASDLRGEHGLRGSPLAVDRFHITLCHLGDYDGLPQGVVTSALEAAVNVTVPAFDVAFDSAMSFPNRLGSLPFVLRCSDDSAALMGFQRMLGVAMAKAGLGRRVSPQFTPHLTLLYDKRNILKHNIETIGWTAREFVLVHSLLGKTQHIPLGRWPLHD